MSASLLDRPAADALRFVLNTHTFGGLPLPDLCAFERGISDAASAVQQTVDGYPTNDIWDEIARTAKIWNDTRGAYVSLLSYRTNRATELVAQASTGSDFERASEFGVPKGVRGGSIARVGADFDWYDLATRFTWRYLTDATREQVESVTTEILSADSRLTFTKIVGAIMNNANRFDDNSGATVFALYNGDGTVPPSYQGVTFDGTTSQYLVSGAATVDPGDVEQMLDTLVSRGGAAAGQKLILLCNKQEGRVIRQWRAGSVYANGATANFDFIPSASAPARISSTHVEGAVPPENLDGLDIFGSYADVLLHETTLMQPGYLVLVASGGPNSDLNPVMFREHSNLALGGLQPVPGPNQTYPLQESYWRRGFGTGVRRRAGAVVMQIKASGSYATPLQYVGI